MAAPHIAARSETAGLSIHEGCDGWGYRVSDHSFIDDAVSSRRPRPMANMRRAAGCQAGWVCIGIRAAVENWLSKSGLTRIIYVLFDPPETRLRLPIIDASPYHPLVGCVSCACPVKTTFAYVRAAPLCVTR